MRQVVQPPRSRRSSRCSLGESASAMSVPSECQWHRTLPSATVPPPFRGGTWHDGWYWATRLRPGAPLRPHTHIDDDVDRRGEAAATAPERLLPTVDDRDCRSVALISCR